MFFEVAAGFGDAGRLAGCRGGASVTRDSISRGQALVASKGSNS